MFDWFYRLFGNYCRIRCKITTTDGREAVVKTTVQAFNIDNEELKEHLKKYIYTEKGIVVDSIEILSIIDV